MLELNQPDARYPKPVAHLEPDRRYALGWIRTSTELPTGSSGQRVCCFATSAWSLDHPRAINDRRRYVARCSAVYALGPYSGSALAVAF